MSNLNDRFSRAMAWLKHNGPTVVLQNDDSDFRIVALEKSPGIQLQGYRRHHSPMRHEPPYWHPISEMVHEFRNFSNEIDTYTCLALVESAMRGSTACAPSVDAPVPTAP